MKTYVENKDRAITSGESGNLEVCFKSITEMFKIDCNIRGLSLKRSVHNAMKVLEEALNNAVLGELYLEQRISFIEKVLSGEVPEDIDAQKQQEEVSSYLIAQVKYFGYVVIGAAVANKKLEILDVLLEKKSITLKAVLDCAIRNEATDVFNHFSTSALFGFDLFKNIVVDYEDHPVKLESVHVIFKSSLTQDQKSTLIQSIIKNRPMVILNLILLNQVDMLEPIQQFIGDESFRAAIISAYPSDCSLKFDELGDEETAKTGLEAFKNTYPNHMALLNKQALFQIGLRQRWYDVAKAFTDQQPLEISQDLARIVFDDLLKYQKDDSLSDWAADLLSENFHKYVTDALDTINVRNRKLDSISNKYDPYQPSQYFLDAALVRYLLRKHLAQYGEQISLIIDLLDRETIFKYPNVLDFFSPNNSSLYDKKNDKNRHYCLRFFMEIAEEKLQHFKDKKKQSINPSEIFEERDRAQIDVIISGLTTEIGKSNIHDPKKKQMMTLCSEYVAIAKAISHPVLWGPVIQNFEQLNKPNLMAEKNTLAKSKLSADLDILIKNITFPKNGRRSSGRNSEKVSNLRKLYYKLKNSLPAENVQDYIEKARELVAIKRNPLHFWQTPHSVKEFEKMLAEIDAQEAPKNKPSP